MSQPHKNLEDYTLQDCSLVGIFDHDLANSFSQLVEN